jgi:hypothetical protein
VLFSFEELEEHSNGTGGREALQYSHRAVSPVHCTTSSSRYKPYLTVTLRYVTILVRSPGMSLRSFSRRNHFIFQKALSSSRKMRFMETDENGPPRLRIVSLKISHRGQFRSRFVDVTCLIPKIIHFN